MKCMQPHIKNNEVLKNICIWFSLSKRDVCWLLDVVYEFEYFAIFLYLMRYLYFRLAFEMWAATIHFKFSSLYVAV